MTEDDAAVTPPSTEAEVDPDGDPFDRDLLGGDNEAVEVDAAKAAADEACHKVWTNIKILKRKFVVCAKLN